jgi:hypothetical protein
MKGRTEGLAPPGEPILIIPVSRTGLVKQTSDGLGHGKCQSVRKAFQYPKSALRIYKQRISCQDGKVLRRAENGGHDLQTITFRYLINASVIAEVTCFSRHPLHNVSEENLS